MPETHTCLHSRSTPSSHSHNPLPSPAPCPQPQKRTWPRLGALPHKLTWGRCGLPASAGRQTTTTRCRYSLDKALCSCCHTLQSRAHARAWAGLNVAQGLTVLCTKQTCPCATATAHGCMLLIHQLVARHVCKYACKHGCMCICIWLCALDSQIKALNPKPLTVRVATTSSLPPTSHTYCTTSRCPPSQADMRQVWPSYPRWPSDQHHTLLNSLDNLTCSSHKIDMMHTCTSETSFKSTHKNVNGGGMSTFTHTCCMYDFLRENIVVYAMQAYLQERICVNACILVRYKVPNVSANIGAWNTHVPTFQQHSIQPLT